MRATILLASLLLIAGCDHGHADGDQSATPEPQMAPALPAATLPKDEPEIVECYTIGMPG